MNKIKTRNHLTEFSCGYIGHSEKDKENMIDELYETVNKLIEDRNNLINRMVNAENKLREAGLMKGFSKVGC